MLDIDDADLGLHLLKPKLRAIETIQATHQGRDLFILRDPARISTQELHVSPEVCAVATLLDGEHNIVELVELFSARYQAEITPSDIQTVIDALEDAHMLEGPTFDAYAEGLYQDFNNAEEREMTLNDGCYPEDNALVSKYIDDFFDNNEVGGLPEKISTDAKPLRLVMLPHIDLRRGGVCYAAGYKKLLETTKPKTVIILGVSHAGSGPMFTFTNKKFQTPFGHLEVDKELSKLLSDAAGDTAFLDEYAHKSEHSIEVQLPLIHHLYKEELPKIVPILLGSFGDVVHGGLNPKDIPNFEEFIKTLGGIIKERAGEVLIIASVDLAHIGHRFGDDVPITPRLLRKNEECDRAMLALVTDLKPDDFVDYIKKEKDRRKVCGLAAIYTSLRIIQESGTKSTGELICYKQSPEQEAQSLVSFASVAFK